MTKKEVDRFIKRLGEIELPVYEKYIFLDNLKKKIARMESAVKESLAEAERKVLESFTETGLKQVKTTDGVTLYLNPVLTAKFLEDREAIANAMRESGLEWLLTETFHKTRLQSHFKEVIAERKLLEENEALPDELKGKLELGSVFKVGIRRT